jgi:serine phosphatase RsbU (regulator of sigma subunit)/anti-sigma regulatory factor (Ser/Thr protein kinase)
MTRFRASAGLLAPAKRSALVTGLAIAVTGPPLATLIAQTSPFSSFRGLPYFVAIVAAAAVGGLLAGGIAALLSSALIGVFLLPPAGSASLRASDWIPVLACLAFGLFVSYLITRRDVATSLARSEKDRAGSAEADLQRRVAQVEPMYQLLDEVGRAESEAEICQRAVETLGRVCEVDHSAVLLFDSEGVMRFRAWHELSDRYRAATEGHSLWSPDVTDPQPIVVEDVAADEDLASLRDTIMGEGIRSLVFIPLVSNGRLIGKLMLYRDRPGSFDPREILLTQTVASHVAFATGRIRAGAVVARTEERLRLALESERETRRRIEALESMAEMGLMATALDDLLDELLGQAGELLGAEHTTLLLIDDEHGELAVTAATGRFGDEEAGFRVPMGQGFAGSIAVSGQSRVVRDLSQVEIYSAHFREAGGSLVGIPLIVESRTLGVLQAWNPSVGAFDEHDLALLRLVGDRVAIAIERTTLYEREHHVSATLQQSLLPDPLVDTAAVGLAARYIPGGDGMNVGGDWYDSFQLPDGRLAMIIGDVVGRGVAAAAAMGQLRNAARAYAYEGFGPAATLERLNRLIGWTGRGGFTTMIFGLLDPETATLTYVCAGHLPPLLISSDGDVSYLEGAHNLPLGVLPEAIFEEECLELAPGTTCILYTDGLIERRGESLDVGLARLATEAACGLSGLDELIGHLVSTLTADVSGKDDVAILGVRTKPIRPDPLRLRFRPEAAALPQVRGDLRSWLNAHGLSEDAVREILVAASEACTNAIEHSGTDPRFPIRVNGDITNGELRIVVQDFGRWKDTVPDPERGNGSILMQGLMDTFHVSPGPEGTTVRMTRSLMAARSD